jgi:hypothetical protein
LILIRDEEQSQWSRDARYGGARRYIPLNKITSVSLTRKEHDLLALSIYLSGSDPITCLFSTSNEREVDLILDRLESVAPGVTRVQNDFPRQPSTSCQTPDASCH